MTGRVDYQWDCESIRALRRELGLTQSEFAARLGKQQQGVSEWERGISRPCGASITLLAMVARQTGYGGLLGCVGQEKRGGAADGSTP